MSEILHIHKSAESGEFYFATPGRNHEKLSHTENLESRDSIRKNVRAHLEFWGGAEKTIQWPDGTTETIKAWE